MDERSKKFIDISDDPFKSESLIPEASLLQQYDMLSDEEKELVFLKIHGFKMKPPTVEQLYTDPYYLGGPDFFDGGTRIFKYWKDNLNDMFPGQLTKCDQICLSGAIGRRLCRYKNKEIR